MRWSLLTRCQCYDICWGQNLLSSHSSNHCLLPYHHAAPRTPCCTPTTTTVSAAFRHVCYPEALPTDEVKCIWPQKELRKYSWGPGSGSGGGTCGENLKAKRLTLDTPGGCCFSLGEEAVELPYRFKACLCLVQRWVCYVCCVPPHPP